MLIDPYLVGRHMFGYIEIDSSHINYICEIMNLAFTLPFIVHGGARFRKHSMLYTTRLSNVDDEKLFQCKIQIKRRYRG